MIWQNYGRESVASSLFGPPCIWLEYVYLKQTHVSRKNRPESFWLFGASVQFWLESSVRAQFATSSSAQTQKVELETKLESLVKDVTT